MKIAIIFGRWLHITAGILWVGLLYFSTRPIIAAAQKDHGGAGKHY